MLRRSRSGVRIISQDRAEGVLRPHHDGLFRVVTGAFGRFQDGPSGVMKLPTIGYLTNTMANLMQDEARDRFSEIEGVEVIEGQNFLLRFGDELLVRLKKVSSQLKTSNYPTERSVSFDGQQSLDDLPPLPRITIGYEPDEAWASLQSVVVLFSIGKRPIWNYELTGKEASVLSMSPLADEVVVKPKQQTNLFDLIRDKKK